MKRLLISLAVLFCLLTVSVSAQCVVQTTSETSTNLFETVDVLNSELNKCPQPVPNPLHYVFRNQVVALEVAMQDGSTTRLVGIVENAKLTDIALSDVAADYTLYLDECSLDTALRHKNYVGVYAYLYEMNLLTIKGHSFGKKLFLKSFSPFISSAAQKVQTQVDVMCTE